MEHVKCRPSCQDASESSTLTTRVVAKNNVMPTDVMHFLLSSTAGLTGIGNGAHILSSLRRSLAVKKDALDVFKLHPSGALPVAFGALFRVATFSEVLILALSRDLIEIVLDGSNQSDMTCTIEPQEMIMNGTAGQCTLLNTPLRLSPQEKVLKNYQDGSVAKHPLRYIERFLSEFSRNMLDNTDPPLELHISDANAFNAMRIEKLDGYTGDTGLYFSIELVSTYIKKYSWNKATEQLREIFFMIMLCDDLNDCGNFDKTITKSFDVPLKAGIVPESRLCQAYEFMLSDIAADKEEREVI